MDKTLNAVVPGPLSGCGEGFVDYLVGLGYAAGSIQLRVNLLKHVSRWLAAEGLDPAEFDSAAVERFIAVRRSDHVDLSSAKVLVPLLAFLRSAGMIPMPMVSAGAMSTVDVILARWREHLLTERGLQVSTIRYYEELARPLLVSRLDGDLVDLDGLDARVVSEFVRDRIPGVPVGTAKLTVTALRSLLRFLFIDGLIAERLDALVLARAGYRDAGLPRGLRPEQVESLIAAAEASGRTGRRDLAIVLLLARLGLRAGEVAGLRLDDVDWRAGTLRIAGKGGQIDLLPLPPDVGEAVAAHLRAGRHPASTGRVVFFRSSAPHTPLSVSAVIAVVRRAGERAGLGAVGAHRLRHSVATATINAGASLEEVAQLLRHRDVSSTTIYAKVDLTRLRRLARLWPGSIAGHRDGDAR